MLTAEFGIGPHYRATNRAHAKHMTPSSQGDTTYNQTIRAKDTVVCGLLSEQTSSLTCIVEISCILFKGTLFSH